jgi:hypothetical protein
VTTSGQTRASAPGSSLTAPPTRPNRTVQISAKRRSPKRSCGASSSTSVTDGERMPASSKTDIARARYEYATCGLFPHNYPQVWMNDTGVTPERRNPAENDHSCDLTCSVALAEILELRKKHVESVTGTRSSGYSHTSVPTLVDELHRCSLLGEDCFRHSCRLHSRCLNHSCRLHSRLGEFDPSLLHQYSRTVTRSEVTDACWVFTVRWSAFSLWDVIRVRPNSVLPPVGAWSGR